MSRQLRVAVSPLSGRIFCGHVLKDGCTWASNKTDVTSDVLKAVIDKVGVGNTVVVTSNGVPEFEITVTAAQQPAQRAAGE